MQKATEFVTSLASSIMPSNLPKTYKIGIFKEKDKPLVFEDVELKLPEHGEVRQSPFLVMYTMSIIPC